MKSTEFFRELANKTMAQRAGYKDSHDPFEQLLYNQLGEELEHYAKAIAAIEVLEMDVVTNG